MDAMEQLHAVRVVRLAPRRRRFDRVRPERADGSGTTPAHLAAADRDLHVLPDHLRYRRGDLPEWMHRRRTGGHHQHARRHPQHRRHLVMQPRLHPAGAGLQAGLHALDQRVAAIVRNGFNASQMSAPAKDKALAEVDRVLAATL